MKKVGLGDIVDGNFELPHFSWEASVPSGVDIDRIEVNTRTFQRTRKICGIGDVAFRPGIQDFEQTISADVNADGSITSATAASQTEMKPDVISDGRTFGFELNYLPGIEIPIDTQGITRTLGESRYPTFTEHYAHEISQGFRGQCGRDQFTVMP